MSKAGHLPLVEIFYSLRGEGHWAGSPATFVRLGTCNLACPGCDTEFNRFTYTSFEEVLRWIKSTPSRWVVFTGGEPLLHDERIAEFQEYVALKQPEAFRYHLETNGTYEIQHSNWDWITCSPKVGNTKRVNKANIGASTYVGTEELSGVLITEANEFKMIMSFIWGTDVDALYRWLQMQAGNECEYFVQPWKDQAYEKNLGMAIQFCLEHPDVRLSLQTHKLIGVR